MAKITHVYMKCGDTYARAAFGKTQHRVGTDTPSDVIDDIANETIQGDVVVLCPYKETRENFAKEIKVRCVALEGLRFLTMAPIEKEVSVPAAPAYKLTGVAGEKEAHIAEEPAHKEKQTIEKRLHLGTVRDMREVKKLLKDATLLVILDPIEEEGDLKCLPQLRKERPDLDVVIFHAYCEKWGVVYEGDVKNPADMFETQTTFEKEEDLQWVINGISHVGESTWFGALPKQSKTWVMLCILLALLTGLPLFGDERFTVPNKATRAIYLIPEAGRGSVKKRLKLLGLIEHLYDPITNPDGRLFIRTLSAGEKIKLTSPALLEIVRGADIFIDTAVRYLEGSENDVEDVKVLTENILNLLAVGARSVWVAHHAAKGFENASNMSLQNMFRGSGEFGAALTNAYGLCQEEEATNKVRFHCITGRDLDEQIPDMILQGRPWLNQIGNFKVIDVNAEPRTAGRPENSLKQQKIDFARTVNGSMQERADAVNSKFGSKHSKSTIHEWLKDFDSDHGVSTND